MFLILYVCDILFIGNNASFLDTVNFHLNWILMKDLGKTRILGINVYMID